MAIEEGLLVPVLRHANTKSLSTIAKDVRTMADKARKRQLQPEDWTGSTFSVSNLGMYGIDNFTAIINTPNACILAVGAVTERPRVIDGVIKPLMVMKMTLSCDHRLVDGAKGAAFLQDLRKFIEEPALMLL